MTQNCKNIQRQRLPSPASASGVAVLSLLCTLTSGCWEEIHYSPAKSQTSQAANNDSDTSLPAAPLEQEAAESLPEPVTIVEPVPITEPAPTPPKEEAVVRQPENEVSEEVASTKEPAEPVELEIAETPDRTGEAAHDGEAIQLPAEMPAEAQEDAAQLSSEADQAELGDPFAEFSKPAAPVENDSAEENQNASSQAATIATPPIPEEAPIPETEGDTQTPRNEDNTETEPDQAISSDEEIDRLFETSQSEADDFVPAPAAKIVELTETPAVSDAEPSMESGAAEQPLEEAPMEVDRAEIWRAASRWSMALALDAKGVNPADCHRVWDEAAAAATDLRVKLPELPASGDEKVETSQAKVQAVEQSLQEQAGPQLWEQIGKQHGAKNRALAELAIRSHRLLLVYTPQKAPTEEIAAELKGLAESAELPPATWSPLVTKLEKQAPFAEVKSAIFAMHAEVARQLAAAQEVPKAQN